MAENNPSYFQHESETSPQIKSRANILSSANANVRRNSYNFQQSRRRSEGVGLLGRPPPTPTYLGDEDADATLRTRSASAMSEQQKANRTIPERVAQYYYSLGLFCSSHPYVIITLASIVVIISW